MPPYRALSRGQLPAGTTNRDAPGKGRVYLHASPRRYRDWLQTTIASRLAQVPPPERLVFINAWNEWAEGAVLEPDTALGHAWLDGTRQALSAR